MWSRTMMSVLTPRRSLSVCGPAHKRRMYLSHITHTVSTETLPFRSVPIITCYVFPLWRSTQLCLSSTCDTNFCSAQGLNPVSGNRMNLVGLIKQLLSMAGFIMRVAALNEITGNTSHTTTRALRYMKITSISKIQRRGWAIRP